MNRNGKADEPKTGNVAKLVFAVFALIAVITISSGISRQKAVAEDLLFLSSPAKTVPDKALPTVATTTPISNPAAAAPLAAYSAEETVTVTAKRPVSTATATAATQEARHRTDRMDRQRPEEREDANLALDSAKSKGESRRMRQARDKAE